MRGVLFSVLALGAIYTGGVAPAAAYDYPYCAQGRGVGIPGDCSYSSYEQCLASASGRNLSCNVNPRAAFRGYREPGYGQRGYYEERRPPRRYRDYY